LTVCLIVVSEEGPPWRSDPTTFQFGVAPPFFVNFETGEIRASHCWNKPVKLLNDRPTIPATELPNMPQDIFVPPEENPLSNPFRLVQKFREATIYRSIYLFFSSTTNFK
jgi:hypothetical protein